MYYTLYTIHYTLYTIHYTLYTIHYALCTIHYTLYTIHLYTIHYTLYTIHVTLRYTIQYYIILYYTILYYFHPLKVKVCRETPTTFIAHNMTMSSTNDSEFMLVRGSIADDIHIYLSLYIYIYIYIGVHMCMRTHARCGSNSSEEFTRLARDKAGSTYLTYILT